MGADEVRVFEQSLSDNEKLCLGVLADKLAHAEQALSRNWLLHTVLLGLCLLAVFRPDDELLDAAREQTGWAGSADIVVLLLASAMVLTFMRFGFLLAQFLLTRRQCDRVAQKLEAAPSGTKFLFQSTNYFEPLHQDEYFRRDGRWIFRLLMCMAMLSVASGNAVAVNLYLRAFEGLGLHWLLVAIPIAPMGICYWRMIETALPGASEEDWAPKSQWIAVVITLVLAVGLTVGLCLWGYKAGAKTGRWPDNWPSESERTYRPDCAAAPYNVALLFEHYVEGRRDTFQVLSHGRPRTLRVERCVRADRFGCDVESGHPDTPDAEPTVWHRTYAVWMAMLERWSYPLDRTTLRWEQITTAAGTFDTVVYVVTEGESATRSVTERWFAFARPGPPIRTLKTVGAQRVFEEDLIESVTVAVPGR